jgi:hypothetical protein
MVSSAVLELSMKNGTGVKPSLAVTRKSSSSGLA